MGIVLYHLFPIWHIITISFYSNNKNSLPSLWHIIVRSIKNYKIERLWIALENYAKNENVELKLEVVDAASKGLYDLNITVAGEYIGITDFIYDIEKDDTLGFKILNFKLTPYVATTTTNNDTNNNTTSNTKNTDDQNQTTQTTTSTTSVRVDKLTATFKVEGVEIEFN